MPSTCPLASQIINNTYLLISMLVTRKKILSKLEFNQILCLLGFIAKFIQNIWTNQNIFLNPHGFIYGLYKFIIISSLDCRETSWAMPLVRNFLYFWCRSYRLQISGPLLNLHLKSVRWWSMYLKDQTYRSHWIHFQNSISK